MSTRLPSRARVALLAWLATVATSVSLFPLFQQKGYLLAGAGAALAVTATGIGLRALRAPVPLVVLAQVAAVVEWAVMTRASAEALYGFLPTADAIAAIRVQLEKGAETAAAYAAPVPSDDNLVLLVALGIAGVAISVDLIAVGLRHVAWAGLPLLTLYTVPVATVPDGVPAIAFAPGAFGFVALLAAEERDRVTSWGKQITRTGQLWREAGKDQIYTAALAQTGRRIGFTAVGLAVLLPILLPAFPERLFTSGSGGSGNGPIAITNPLVDLRRDLVRPVDVDLVYLETSGDKPSYLRLTALDEFDGVSWRPSVRQIPSDQQASAGLPAPPGLLGSVATTRTRSVVEVDSKLTSTWLPTFYPPVSVDIEGDWRYDVDNFDIVSAEEDTTTAGVRYVLESLAVQPTSRQLQEAGSPPPDLADFYTRLPAGLPSEIRRQARLVTTNAATDFERAVILQDWFRSSGGFTYSLAPAAGNSANTLLNFLTVDRVGYCEQFAAAMAVLARSLDIPARVAVGFLRPEQSVAGADSYVFSAHDMHSWPELYFQGVGWVRFEPTPAARTGDVPAYTSGVPVPATPGGGSALPEPTPVGPDEIVNRAEQGQPAPADSAAGDGSGAAGADARWLLAPLLLAALLLPALARLGLSRWRWRRAGGNPVRLAESSWAELRDHARDLGIPWPDGLTPRKTGAWLRDRLGGISSAQRALDRVVGFVERARYAREVGSPPPARADVQAVVNALRGVVSRPQRWRAVLLPASLLPDLSAAWSRLREQARGSARVPHSRTNLLELPAERV